MPVENSKPVSPGRVYDTVDAVAEDWRIDNDFVAGQEAAAAVTARLSSGVRSTWLTSTTGRSIGLVTNGERAMLVVMNEPGDPGVHAVDPSAGSGRSGGFI